MRRDTHDQQKIRYDCDGSSHCCSIRGIRDGTPYRNGFRPWTDGDFTFEEEIDRARLVVIGKIIGLDTKIFTEDLIDIDEDSSEYIFRTDHIPMKEITILISEEIKDGIGWTSEMVTVYGRRVRGDVGRIGGEKAVFNYGHAIDYHIVDRGIFMIESDRGLYLSGFAGHYPIIQGKTTITSEFYERLGNNPIDLREIRKCFAF